MFFEKCSWAEKRTCLCLLSCLRPTVLRESQSMTWLPACEALRGTCNGTLTPGYFLSSMSVLYPRMTLSYFRGSDASLGRVSMEWEGRKGHFLPLRWAQSFGVKGVSIVFPLYQGFSGAFPWPAGKADMWLQIPQVSPPWVPPRGAWSHCSCSSVHVLGFHVRACWKQGFSDETQEAPVSASKLAVSVPHGH